MTRSQRISFLILILNLSFLIIILTQQTSVYYKTSIKKQSNTPLNRIYCFVLTSPQSLATQKAEAVFDSWAHECDGLRFITVLPSNLNKTKQEIFPNEKSHDKKLPLLQPYGFYEENYKNLTTRVYKSIIDAYKTKLDDYEWFLKADDDTFVFVDHLRQFLSRKEIFNSTYFGYDLYDWVSGEAGYVMSRQALSKIGHALDNNSLNCSQNTGVENQDVCRCLTKLGIKPGVSLDE
jgi:glycoprotein-N-acetylgalactosamine 3-beta-galactosyltransferase